MNLSLQLNVDLYVENKMTRPPEGWHVGKSRCYISDIFTGFVETGYFYMGGPEKEPYRYNFWGLVWRGKRSFGVGRVKWGEYE